MASRIFWIFITCAAIVAGFAIQYRDTLFGWGHDGAADRSIEARIDRSIDSSFDGIQVVSSDGKTIDVPPETKRALGNAVGRLVSAETQLALLKLRHADEAEVAQATASRDAARGEVDRLKTEIDREKQLSDGDREAVRGQIQQTIRENIRDSIRSAVRS